MSIKKIKLFSIEDPYHELESLTFINRPAIVIIGALVAASIASIFVFFAGLLLLGIAIGAVLALPLCVLPVFFDKQKEFYYENLLNSLESELNGLGFPLNHDQVLTLVATRSLTVDNEHTLVTKYHDDSKDKSLEIFCHYLPDDSKTLDKKPAKFEVNIVESATIEKLATVDIVASVEKK